MDSASAYLLFDSLSALLCAACQVGDSIADDDKDDSEAGSFLDLRSWQDRADEYFEFASSDVSKTIYELHGALTPEKKACFDRAMGRGGMVHVGSFSGLPGFCTPGTDFVVLREGIYPADPVRR